MTQAGAEYAQQTEPIQVPKVKSAECQQPATGGDILLNTFQIKKKRYRVLLNYDHLVWEAFDRKQSQQHAQQHNAEALNEKQTIKKETEYESEQLAEHAYGSHSNVVHIDELIRVAKAATKAALTRQPTGATAASAGTESAAPPTEQYLCLHYAERIVKSGNDCNRWHVRTLTLYNSDAYVVKQWHAVLSKMLSNAARLRVQRLLVFINPYGGRKQGLQTYERHCKPIFQLANIDASCIISQRANQIRDILMSHDLKQYDAVCCVGGDGTVAEVINGLIYRTMCDQGMDTRMPPYIPKPCLPIGIIPAGSTDTVAYSLHGTSDVRTAAIHLILGQRRGLDVCSVRNRQGIVRFCASVLSYGYLGDVAAKSEKYRWMGTKRYEYTGVKAFLSNRGYEAEIRLFESPPDEEPQPSTSSSTLNQPAQAGALDSKCYANCQRCSTATSLQNMQGSWLSKSYDNISNAAASAAMQPADDHDSVVTFHNLETVKKNLMSSHLQKEKSAKQLLSDAVELPVQEALQNASVATLDDNSLATAYGIPDVVNAENCKIIKGKFFMISGANITCACSRSPNGISRYSHLGDGHLDLILVRKTSLLNNVKFLINTMGRNGDIRNLPFVEVYRTRSFSFRTQHSVDNGDYSVHGSCHPITEQDNAQSENEFSRWNCDGEVVNDLDITMTSHCQLIDVFMRGPYPSNKLMTKSDDPSLMNCCCAK